MNTLSSTDELKIKEELMQALKNLGDTPDIIADNLSAAGCEMDPYFYLDTSRCNACPVANFVRKGSEFTRTSVFQEEIRVTTKGGIVLKVTPPQPVQDFIEAFDKGRYPELGPSIYNTPMGEV